MHNSGESKSSKYGRQHPGGRVHLVKELGYLSLRHKIQMTQTKYANINNVREGRQCHVMYEDGRCAPGDQGGRTWATPNTESIMPSTPPLGVSQNQNNIKNKLPEGRLGGSVG